MYVHALGIVVSGFRNKLLVYRLWAYIGPLRLADGRDPPEENKATKNSRVYNKKIQSVLFLLGCRSDATTFHNIRSSLACR